jgi:tetratricopeptide (TPR) repeat protein
MVEHFKEKYGLEFEDYLRVPIAHHVIVTAKKEVVETKTPLQMAMYLEKKAAESYKERDYHVAEQRFVKAAKMYRDAGLHADSRDIREGLFASSKFCMGWAHLTRVMHLVLNQKHDDLHLLQSELNQARSCFGISKPYFEKFNKGAAGIAREMSVLESVLDGYQETLLADFLMHIGDRDASLRHYAKAREMYKEAKAKTELHGLRSHVEESLECLYHYEKVSQTSAPAVESRDSRQLEAKYGKEDLIKILESFRILQRIKEMTNEDHKASEYVEQLNLLKGYTEGFDTRFIDDLDNILRRIDIELLPDEFVPDKSKSEIRRVCLNGIDIWGCRVLEGGELS